MRAPFAFRIYAGIDNDAKKYRLKAIGCQGNWLLASHLCPRVSGFTGAGFRARSFRFKGSGFWVQRFKNLLKNGFSVQVSGVRTKNLGITEYKKRLIGCFQIPLSGITTATIKALKCFCLFGL